MAKIEITETVNAPVTDVWAAWDDYGNIDKFNPNLNRSFLIDDSGETGLGAQRQCDMSDGKNFIQERIVEYVPQKKMVVDVYHGTLPLKSAKATISMKPLAIDRTELSFTMEFTPGMGLLGRLMIPMMKPQFRRALTKLVAACKAYVETGEEVKRAA